MRLCRIRECIEYEDEEKLRKHFEEEKITSEFLAMRRR